MLMLCFVSLLKSSLWVFFHQANGHCHIIVNSVCNHSVILSFNPQFFLENFLHLQRAMVAFLVYFWMWGFHVSFWSKMAPRYFASVSNGISRLASTSGFRPFFSKDTISVFEGSPIDFRTPLERPSPTLVLRGQLWFTDQSFKILFSFSVPQLVCDYEMFNKEVKERYPAFINALRYLDDCLTVWVFYSVPPFTCSCA